MDDAGIPPGNDHSQSIGLLVVRSVKEIQSLLHNRVSLEANAATGGGQLTTVIIPPWVSISEPNGFKQVKDILYVPGLGKHTVGC